MIGSFKKMEEKRAQDQTPPIHKLNHPALRSPWLPVFGSVFSGVLLALAFPGVGGDPALTFMALVPLMYAVASTSAKKAAGLGLLAGFIFFIITLSWLHNLTGMVAGVGLKLSALLGYVVLALYCALYFIPFAVTVALGTQQWLGSNVWKNVRLMFAITMVWVGSEYLRGLLFTGFPWNPLGVSQYANLAIIQIAEWGGVSCVSAIIVWMNVGLFITLRQYTHGTSIKKYRPHFELMLGLLPVALSMTYGMNILFNPPPLTAPVSVALVQPNIAQSEKWDETMDQQVRDTLEELTLTVGRLDDLDLIVWPETAVPDFVRASRPSYDLVQRMAAQGTPLLVGTMDFSETETGRTYHNSSILFGTNGVEVAKYHKQHLVPFGEYVPFPKLMGKFTPVAVDFAGGTESTLMPLKSRAPFSVLICFEDIVAPLSVNATRAGARWLINQTNDAWFDPGSQSEQHFAHAVFRCIENRIPMARCCNTGVSGVIDAFGNVQRSLEPRTAGFMVGEIHPRRANAPKTFYTRHGDAFSKFAFAAGATVLFVLRSKGWKRRSK